MSDDLRQMIQNNLNLKETDELLSIWQTNDRAAWTDMSFELIEEILRERLGEVPPQTGPQLPLSTADGDQKAGEDGLADWEEKLLADEGQPEFYDPLEVVSLVSTINKVAVASIVLNVIVGLNLLSSYRDLFLNLFQMNKEVVLTVLFILVTIAAGVGLQIVLTYFSLKALAYILRILAEMEFNSRKA